MITSCYKSTASSDSFCNKNLNPLVTGLVTFISHSNTANHCLEFIIKTIYANFTEKTSTTTINGQIFNKNIFEEDFWKQQLVFANYKDPLLSASS